MNYQQQHPQMFGILIPGGNVRTDFVTADASGTKLTLTLTSSDISPSSFNPSSIPDLVLFLLPGVTLPPESGAVIYWQASSPSSPNSATGFQVLGALTHQRPSGIFRTGWAQNEDIIRLQQQQSYINVIIGISIEPLGSISNLSIESTGVEDRTNTAKGIAMDLFNFLQSFDDTGSSNRPGWMTVPNNVFDRWMTRFTNKMRLDPNFFMKNNGNS